MQVPSLPPSRIYLLRHAQAGGAQPGERDFDRRLDNTGYAQAESVAEHASDRLPIPDVVLSSTAVRCRETAEAIIRAYNNRIDIAYIDEMYNAQPETYLALIASQGAIKSLMIIGHNPTLDHVLEILIGQQQMNSRLPSGFPTAGLAVVDFVSSPSAENGEWRLTEFLSP